jgi:hypothetical protein
MNRFYFIIVLLAAAVLGSLAGLALGEDFRVDNKVFVGDQKEPSSQSTTIFHRGIVYDCMKKPAETVVFDKAAGRFILLSLGHRTRTELTTDEIAAFVDRLQPLAAKSNDPPVKFLAEPKFQEHFDQSASELTLSSPWITYRVTLAHETNRGVVEQYHEFCDWYARLNALLLPGSLPPFGRLVVDAAVAQRQCTPSRVVLTISSGKGGKRAPTKVHSEHKVVLPLERADLNRVAQARESQTSFKLVTFEQYRKAGPR